MRKNTKNNILEIFATLYEAHAIAKGYIDDCKYENANDLLCDCQETAIELGNAIDQSEGDSFDGICFFEQYCEALYQVATAEAISGEDAKAALDEKLKAAENSVKKIQTKLEIVFLPYKASMWDSLESVWRAADADPQCNAHVVPIPYFSRNPDFTLGAYHYEGGDLPADVPVTNYRDFDIEALHPDVIYIHNPYDAFNRVTSVLPQFYSSELKKQTDMLVYVPYYVVANHVNPSMLRLACIDHVDKVVVQSDIVCDDFRNAYLNSGTNNSKFVALGSPKFDTIVNASKDDYILPEEWKSIIGERKPVLYNTSIGAALSDPTLYLKKMAATFKYFSDSKEYVLWWRPHPLLESTFKSMLPALYNEYIELRDNYISSAKGIYDCTNELQRAVICSDIYYGDYQSSVAILYCATGKPIISAHIDKDADVSGFEEDYGKYYRDNSMLDILKRNKNYDGTAGHNIHQYIKGELI